MKLKVISLFMSFALINISIIAMEEAESESNRQALIESKELINQGLHVAVQIDDVDDVKNLIIEKNADVNSYDTNGSTALVSAIIKGYWDIVRFLLDRNDINVNLPDKKGLTPLSAAIQRDASRIVAKLLEKGA